MKHIVLIDDDMFIRDLVATKMSLENYSVDTAANGAEGLQKIYEKKPDLILLDLDLPDIHGLEILKKLKATSATVDIPVIIFSNNDSTEMQQQIKEAGAAEFFLKIAVDMTELGNHVAKYV